ncbi:MAG: O-acetylhomoserine aminocarboxypropyltransferase/cysteine synthase [Marinilabiliaceae bacterium]|nr:O-acetylhomoserine aminocarboxypropyltransferase/cysteine synthase [Marinilabiliaceae bacterium]
MSKGYTTKSLHVEYPQKDGYGSLHMPVYDGVAFEFASAEDMEVSFSGRKFAHAYSRTTNPTVEYFEKKMKAITGAYSVLALSSGMAAISSALLSVVEKGGNIISSNRLFGHTYALMKETLPNMGLEVRFGDVTKVNDLKELVDENTRVVFFETITNPHLEIADILQLSDFCKPRNILLMCDSTTTPPYVFNSERFGVDVEVMSTTKFISGGATAFGGVVLDNGTFDWSQLPGLKKWSDKFGKNAFISRLRKEIFRHLGGAMTANTAHFMNIGLDVLALRLDKIVSNCIELGERLNEIMEVKNVNYPGIKGNKGYDIACRQFNGKPGGVLTFELESQEFCFGFMNKLKMIRRATNLNDNKTLIIHPYSTIYSEFSSHDREQMGISSAMLRVSVGIEDVEDLISDISQALG